MDKNNEKYSAYLRILEEELIPAMGCTDPVGIAFCAAYCKKLIGDNVSFADITEINIVVSNNLMKNAKSVIVPNTDGNRGIKTAVAIGVVAGDSEKGLEVIADVSEKDIKRLNEALEILPINISASEGELVLEMAVEIKTNEARAYAQIWDEYTNVVFAEQDGKVILDTREAQNKCEDKSDYDLLSVEDVYDFSTTVNIQEVKAILQNQIKCNMEIAEEGMSGNYGASIGKIIMNGAGGSVKEKVKAMAAAASDARMNGCNMPVVINSSSGNQGISASVPVIVYARELGKSEEELLRALTLSNLITIYQKKYIGRLSAFCGAVSAGAGASAGIALLDGGGYEEVIHSIVNTLAIASGMVCDGAKSSCAAKIAIAVEAGYLGFEMFKNGQQFYGGEGIIAKGVENTIQNVGYMGKIGMKQTDKEIIKIMIERT